MDTALSQVRPSTVVRMAERNSDAALRSVQNIHRTGARPDPPRGRERLEHMKLRFDRRRVAPASAQDDSQPGPTGVEGEMNGAGSAGDPPTNFDDDEMHEQEDSEDDDMRYSPASPGTPMSVQQLVQCTETATMGAPDQDRGESGESPCGDAVAESDRHRGTWRPSKWLQARQATSRAANCR